MARLRRWSGQGVSSGVLSTSTAGSGDDAFSDVVGSWVVDTSNGKVRLQSDNSSGQSQFIAWKNLASQTTSYSEFLLELSALPSGNAPLFLLSGSGTLQFFFGVNESGTPYMRDVSQVKQLAGFQLQADVEYSVHVTQAASSASATIYNGATKVGSFDYSGGTFGTFDSIIFGQNATGKNIATSWISQIDVEQEAPDVDPPTPVDGTVAVIGDSLTFQNGNGEAKLRQMLQAAGWGANQIYFYSRIGKPISTPDRDGKTTVDNIAEARSQLGEPNQWLIALGTNNHNAADSTLDGYINTVMNTLGSSSEVVWAGLGFRTVNGDNVVSVNRRIRAAVDRYSNLRYADWQSWIHNGRDETSLWSLSDSSGFHMTGAGYDLRNEFYTLALQHKARPAVSVWQSSSEQAATLSYWNGRQEISPGLAIKGTPESSGTTPPTATKLPVYVSPVNDTGSNFMESYESRLQAGWGTAFYTYWPGEINWNSDWAAFISRHPNGIPVLGSPKGTNASNVNTFMQNLPQPWREKWIMAYFQEPEDNFTTDPARANYRASVHAMAELVRPYGAMNAVHLQEWAINPFNNLPWGGEANTAQFVDAADIDYMSWSLYPAQGNSMKSGIDRIKAFSEKYAPGVPWGVTAAGSPVKGSDPIGGSERATRASIVRQAADYTAQQGGVAFGWFDFDEYNPGRDQLASKDPALASALNYAAQVELPGQLLWQ